MSPTGGPVCHYACNPAELKSKLEWHKEAMTEWLADPMKRHCLVREIMDGLSETKEDALRSATVIHPTRFIEDGRLFFVTKRTGHATGGLSISQL